jgi:demethylmenaquinone methyltransferase/2-methoxy-6-polyprenyl-1,4-benzoquinol methylase
LDVGCGTGDLTVELSRHHPKAVIGIDFSLPMVTIGHQKIIKLNLTNLLSLGIGDALHLPFPDETFDTVATAFTLRNLSDYSAGIREMRRVTRKGGKFVCIEICPWDNGLLSRIFHLMFQKLVPLLGLIFGRDRQAYKYLPSSVSQFLQAKDITDLLTTLGFNKVKCERIAMGAVAIHIGTAE